MNREKKLLASLLWIAALTIIFSAPAYAQGQLLITRDAEKRNEASSINQACGDAHRAAERSVRLRDFLVYVHDIKTTPRTERTWLGREYTVWKTECTVRIEFE